MSLITDLTLSIRKFDEKPGKLRQKYLDKLTKCRSLKQQLARVKQCSNTWCSRATKGSALIKK